jgi:hypothetical protein
MKITSFVLSGVVAVGLGCSADEISVPTSMQVGALAAPVAQKHAPAANAFASLTGMAANGTLSSATFGVYSLVAPDKASNRLKSRGTALKMAAASPVRTDDLMHLATVEDGAWSLTVNDLSEGEELVDNSRNQLGTTVPEASLAAESDYITTGRDYATKTFGDAFAGMSPYAYRVRKYFGAHSDGHGSQVDGVYQLAVAFNSTVDGLPVIGPGGKVAVDMTTSGAVIRHEGSLRHPKALLQTVRGQRDLVTPEAAEAAVNARLDARGIDRTQFKVTRREFGYFMHGRKSVQTVLVPHYAFFFEPMPGIMSKILVEIEPATNDPSALARLAADAKAEAARKGPLKAKPDDHVVN